MPAINVSYRGIGVGLAVVLSLLIIMPFWLAWSGAVLGGFFLLDLWAKRKQQTVGPDEVFWMMIGALIPVYYIVL